MEPSSLAAFSALECVKGFGGLAITSLASHGGYLYVGTAQGVLRVLKVISKKRRRKSHKKTEEEEDEEESEDEGGPGGELDNEWVGEVVLRGDRVEKVDYIGKGLVVVLCGGRVDVVRVGGGGREGKEGKEKGVEILGTISVKGTVDTFCCGNPTGRLVPTHICMAIKENLFMVKISKPGTFLPLPSLPSPALCLEWKFGQIFAGTAHGYFSIDLSSEQTTTLHTFSPPLSTSSASFSPFSLSSLVGGGGGGGRVGLVVKTYDDRVVTTVGGGKILFFDFVGENLPPPLCREEGEAGGEVIGMAVRHPYLLCMYRDGVVVFNILERRQIQKIPLQGACAISGSSSVFVATTGSSPSSSLSSSLSSSIFILQPASIASQVKHLLKLGKSEEALSLYEEAISHDPKVEKQAHVLAEIGFSFFRDGKFFVAFELFGRSPFLPLRQILAFFPEFKDKRTQKSRREDTVVGIIQKNITGPMVQEALNEVREYLIALLEEKRRPLSCCSPPSPIPSSTPSPSSFSESEMEESEVEEGGRGRGRGGKKGSLLEEEIDTALMRAYGCNSANWSKIRDLLMSPNHCLFEEGMRVLRSLRTLAKVSEKEERSLEISSNLLLGLLYQCHGRYQEALQIWLEGLKMDVKEKKELITCQSGRLMAWLLHRLQCVVSFMGENEKPLYLITNMKNEVIPPLEKRLEMVLRYSRVLLERIPRVGMWVFTNRRADERLFCDPQGRPRSLQSRDRRELTI